MARPIKAPSAKISPSLCADINDEKQEWKNAGFIFVPDSPTLDVNRIIKNIYYGCDDNNFYCRFEINKNSIKMNYDNLQNQIVLYFMDENAPNHSPIRFISKNENVIYPIIKHHFSSELKFALQKIKFLKLL